MEIKLAFNLKNRNMNSVKVARHLSLIILCNVTQLNLIH